MPPSVKPKMFIASASCEENSPSRSHSPTAAPTTVETGLKVGRGCCIVDGISAESSPPANNNNNKSKGFSVCDILMEQRSTGSNIKTVPLIVVSGHSRAVNNKPTDFLPIQPCDDNNQRSPCSNSDYSLSPASSIKLTDKASAGQQHDISRRLKFGVDRILSDDSRVPPLATSHNTAGDVCGPSCTCADDMVQMPTFINSRPSFRNPSSTNYEYPPSHCDVNRHAVTAFYPSNVLPTPYAPTPWTIQSHYGHHHHHLLYPITTAVYPVTHMGAGGNALMDPARGYHHYQSHHHHHHGGMTASASGAAGSAASAASAAAGVNVGGGKRKRSWSRAVFSNLQRKGLEKRFQIQKYITKPDRRQLAATLGLTDAQVKVWFQNRRMKWRHSKEAKEELAKQTTVSSAAVKVTESECRKLERTSAASSEPVDKPVELCLKGSEQPC